MIQAKDLRIGNWILLDTNKTLPQWHKVHSEDIYNIENCKIESLGIVLEPIPLTPKILEKAGAIRRHGNEWFLGKLKFDLNSTGKIIRFHYSGKVAYIDHVHTLQNLVFALTGTELTIEL